MISFVFFGFVALVFSALFLVNKFSKNTDKCIFCSNLIITVSSFVFTIYADWKFAMILAAVIVSTWFFTKKKLYSVGIIIALGALAFFKYTEFFAESFAKLFGNDFTALNIMLPLGISFYTFSAISYIVDVKRGKTECRDLKDVALYLSFFPKLTSGPIQKSSDFFEQADKKREIGRCTFENGIQIFLFGLFKKLVFADHLSVFVNQVYSSPDAFGSATVFMAVIAYSLQIYFDFSGYSDMAVGAAQILGFSLPRNFNLPYISHNVTEFWKRWHITLSSWLQEYLYIGLGGNRKGKARTYVNLIITMVLGGIWHGANWTYVLWGLLHGIALAIHKVWMSITKSDKKTPSLPGSVISIIATFLFTSFCWIFFRADSLSKAIKIIIRIFSFEKGLEQPYMWLFVSVIVLTAATVFAFRKSTHSETVLKKLNVSKIDGYYPTVNLTSFWGLVAFFIFCGLILCFAYTGGSPFIYGNY